MGHVTKHICIYDLQIVIPHSSWTHSYTPQNIHRTETDFVQVRMTAVILTEKIFCTISTKNVYLLLINLLYII